MLNTINSKMDTPIACHLCHQQTLKLFPSYQSLPRVTSDCAVWPAGGKLAICTACDCVQHPIDKTWHAEVSEIYSQYHMYHQSAGCEQAVFCNGMQPISRSAKIFHHAFPYINLKKAGYLLDIGCANGELLRFFGKQAPQWKMWGFEANDQCREQVEKIDGVSGFVSGTLNYLDQSFDLITLIHVLEHLPNPQQWLIEIKKFFKPGGVLLIQVPHTKENPFDLLVADHCSHFTLLTLMHLVQQSGYKIITASDSWVNRELSLLAIPNTPDSLENYFNHNVSIGIQDSSEKIDAMLSQLETSSRYSPQPALQWLHDIVGLANNLSKNQPLGVWGTAIAATWFFSIVENRVDFFIDEDPNRIGKQHLGRPIYSPDKAPRGSNIFMPLTAELAANIAHRWPDLRDDLHMPLKLVYNDSH